MRLAIWKEQKKKVVVDEEGGVSQRRRKKRKEHAKVASPCGVRDEARKRFVESDSQDAHTRFRQISSVTLKLSSDLKRTLRLSMTLNGASFVFHTNEMADILIAAFDTSPPARPLPRCPCSNRRHGSYLSLPRRGVNDVKC